MTRCLPTLLAAALAACAGPAETRTGVAEASAPRPMTFQRAMESVGRGLGVVQTQLLRNPQGDLKLAADAARDAASLMRLGYTRFRADGVPEFGSRARGAETWLLRIAAEADQNRGAIARSLLRDGRERHCQRCHDACEAVR